MSVSPELLHTLVNHALGFGRQMLEREGEFYPFAYEAEADGTIGAVGLWTGEEHPEPREMYRLYVDSAAAKARDNKISAFAVAADVTIPPQYGPQYPDGIRVQIEAVGYARYIYFPYSVEKISRVGRLFRAKRALIVAEPFAVEIAPEVFARSGS